MAKDIFGNTVNVGDVVVFTTTPHRGHSPTIRAGRILKLYDSGRVSIQEYDTAISPATDWWFNAATGRKTIINGTQNVVRW